MIPRATVTAVILARGKCLTVVYGKGLYCQERRRTFKNFDRACKYSLELSDYYQLPVTEQNL
jgi:hypothetical protein